jgi:hypothetical protein
MSAENATVCDCLEAGVSRLKAKTPRGSFEVEKSRANNPTKITVSQDEMAATGKLQTAPDTWAAFTTMLCVAASSGPGGLQPDGKLCLGTPETYAAEGPQPAGAFALAAKGKFAAALRESIASIDGGGGVAWTHALKPTLERLLTLLDEIPDGAGWAHGGLRTLNELCQTIGYEYTVRPIQAYFLAGAELQSSLQDPEGDLRALDERAARLVARLEELDSLALLDMDGDWAGLDRVLQHSEHSDERYASMEEYNNPCLDEQTRLEEQLWETRTALLRSMPALLRIVFESFSGDNEIDQQVGALQGKAAEASRICDERAAVYTTKQCQIEAAVKQLKAEVRTVLDEQKEADRAAVARRATHGVMMDEHARSQAEMAAQIAALVERYERNEAEALDKIAKNDAGEATHQRETAARTATVAMKEACEDEIAPYANVFEQSAAAVGVMQRVATSAIGAVVEHTRAKVGRLAAQEGRLLTQVYTTTCEAHAGLVDDCARAEFALHTIQLQLDANRAAFVTAQKMRNRPKMQALTAKRAEITDEKQVHSEVVIKVEERMAVLKTDAFESTLARLGHRFFDEADDDGFVDAGDSEAATVREAVREWAQDTPPPAAPFDEIERTRRPVADAGMQQIIEDEAQTMVTLHDRALEFFTGGGRCLANAGGATVEGTPVHPADATDKAVLVVAGSVAGGTQDTA